MEGKYCKTIIIMSLCVEEVRPSVSKGKHASLLHINVLNIFNANFLQNVQSLGFTVLYSSQLWE